MYCKYGIKCNTKQIIYTVLYITIMMFLASVQEFPPSVPGFFGGLGV